MKRYLDLVNQYARAHKKKNRVTMACIALAVCLVTGIFGLADAGIQAQQIQMINMHGNYHIFVRNLTDDQETVLKQRRDIDFSGRLEDLPTITFHSKDLRIKAVEEQIAYQMGLTIEEGHFPVKDHEIILDRQAMQQFGLSVGEKVSLPFDALGDKSFEISGVYGDMSFLKNQDIHQAFLTISGLRSLATPASTGIFVKFKDGVNIQQAAAEIQEGFGLTEKEITKNDYVLATMGQSTNETALNLYMTGGILFLLVLLASCIMISNSFNMNVMDRTRFYGLLRCLGASKRQVKRFVLKEGLLLCLKGIPIGLIIGSVGVCLSAFFLKEFNGSLFSSINPFQISPVGLAAGGIMGLLSVLLSARTPAKRASRISPLTAVSSGGDAQTVQTFKKSAYKKGIPVDLAMGISHATARKKSLFLMVGSFAISIILFVGFSVLLNFARESMRPLSASSPDITLYDPSESLRISRAVADEAANIDGVRTVYGRSVSTLDGEAEGTPGKYLLVSYETNQFEWARETLIKGKIDIAALQQENLLLALDNQAFHVGDTVTLTSNGRADTFTVAGLLKRVPFDALEETACKFIISEENYQRLTGISDYDILDLKLEKDASDETITAIRNRIPAQMQLRDRRQSNHEGQNAYYTLVIFIYGFLFLILLITLFHIVNSMNISVAARAKNYGMMRAVGTSVRQIRRMVVAEAVTYSLLGCLSGGALGVLLHWFLSNQLLSQSWEFPLSLVLSIIALVLIITVLSVISPVRKISRLDITEVINIQ